MKNKLSIILISTILLSSSSVVADIDESRAKLTSYSESEKFDLLGHKGEKLYFELRNDFAKGNIIKEIEFDMKMNKETYRMGSKILDDNAIIYGSLLAFYGVKTSGVIKPGEANDTILRVIKRTFSF